jgi:hypothetical protein
VDWICLAHRSCERCNEFSGSIRGGKFLDWLSDYWLLKKDSASSIWLVGYGYVPIFVKLIPIFNSKSRGFVDTVSAGYFNGEQSVPIKRQEGNAQIVVGMRRGAKLPLDWLILSACHIDRLPEGTSFMCSHQAKRSITSQITVLR